MKVRVSAWRFGGRGRVDKNLGERGEVPLHDAEVEADLIWILKLDVDEVAEILQRFEVSSAGVESAERVFDVSVILENLC
jgi:hypothetical protein